MTVDVVCVLNSDLLQVFENARAIKATVAEEAKLMEHPIESGASIVDHRVVLPTEVELSLILAGDTYVTTYQQVREYFARGELLTVQTRTGSYPSMVIAKMPHEETPDLYDGITLALSLREVVIVQAQFSALKVARKADAKTVKRGEQQAQEPKKQSSVLSGIFK